nr:hypothetical protein [Tanacetum cinerariifolium]
KQSSSTSTASQNLAFVSSSHTDSTTDSISAVASVSAACAKLPASPIPNVDSLSNAAIYSFFTSQSTSPQLDNEDLKQIDVDDLEEMDLRWKGHFSKECRSSKDPRRPGAVEPQRRTAPVETSTSNALVSQCDGTGSYDWSYQAEEEPANFTLMAFSSSSSDNKEVILNGDSPVPTRIVEGVLQPVAPTTAEQRLAHAKTLMEAIEKRFCGNTDTKKVQKTLLKQQFENFTGSSSEGLDQIHDRLQNLRNKVELEEQSLDDLFNSPKIYKTEVKLSSSTSTASQNLAFVSSSHTDSTTESVSAAASVSATCAKLPASPLPNINVDDLEEMDLRWQMAMLTMRARRFLQKTGKNLGVNGPTSMGFDMSKVECYNYHRKGHFARECRSFKDPRRPVEEEPANFALMDFSSSSSDNETGLESVEARLLIYKQNESVFEENIKLFNIEVQLRYTALATLSQKLDKAEKDKDDLKLKLEKFQTSSKNLTELLASQTKSDYKSWPPSSLYYRFQSSGGYHADLSHTTRPSAPIIEDWFSDSETESEPKAPQFVPSFAQSSEHVKSPRHTVQQIKTTIPDATPVPASPKSNSSGQRRNRKAFFVCKSYAPLTNSKPQKHMVPTAVLTQSKPVSNTAVRPVSVALPNITVTRPRHAHHVVTKFKSPIRRHTTRSPTSKTSNSPPRVTAV